MRFSQNYLHDRLRESLRGTLRLSVCIAGNRIIIILNGGLMAEFTLRIERMHCGSCVRRVSQALASTPGIAVDEVRVGAARFHASDDPAPVDAAIAALAKAGYPARVEQ
jgi:copper chaperone